MHIGPLSAGELADGLLLAMMMMMTIGMMLMIMMMIIMAATMMMPTPYDLIISVSAC